MNNNDYIHSSYQHDEQLYSSSSRLPSVLNADTDDEDDEFALVALDLMHYEYDDNDINNINSNSNIGGSNSNSNSSTRRCSFTKFPILIGIIMWVVCMTAEFSPIIMIASRFDNDNNGNNNNDDYQHHHGGKRNGSVHSNKNNRNKNDDDYDNYDVVGEAQKNAQHEMMGFSSSTSTSISTTPFDCLSLRYNTNVRGGCGGTPWTNDVCAVQCDATNCIELLKEAASSMTSSSSSSSSGTSTSTTSTTTTDTAIIITEDCDVDCPIEWCEKKMLCSGGGGATTSANNASYQCTGGSSIYGCSLDKYQWTVRSSISDCSSCCKTTTC
ncbi:hypothetical protein FRACYDRAFT_246544 [Fragilariopsis cylindrus CCMP1102]|uniref:Uncharacterized protein n=1 Tax=Fragilariopsis cylindrus CCMP1102 TaxID=635003 RepID=A0A1E7EY55_9STRA|nr:hypothetical protein FRACYDRAFT_246544 [Fragilariopsis cylindrus CCMP1102]|eukprot:OEU10735.1 hypothetical protein FRACYDRAFT_246544 [Fragilariopsis cylindrus CCMP1102]